MPKIHHNNPQQSRAPTKKDSKNTKGRKTKLGGLFRRRVSRVASIDAHDSDKTNKKTLSQELQDLRIGDLSDSSTETFAGSDTSTSTTSVGSTSPGTRATTVEAERHITRKSDLNSEKSQSFHQYLIQYVERHPGTLPPTEIVQRLIDQDYDNYRLKHMRFSSGGLQRDDSSSVPAHLVAAQDLMERYVEFHQQVAGQTRKVPGAGPRDYSVVEAFSPKMRRQIFQVLQDFLRPRILQHNDSSKTKTPAEAAVLLKWMQPLVDHIQHSCPELDLTSWRGDMDSLLQSYIDSAVRGPYKDLLPSSFLENTDDMRRNADGHIETGHPERILFFLRQEMTVAEAKLSHDHTQKVWAACYQELSKGMVADIMLHIGVSWQSIHPARYCSIINDSVHLVDLLEKLLEEHPLDEPYKRHADALLGELTELSMNAVSFLCQRILQDLQEGAGILTSIGTSKWANNEGVVECTAATLNDYFSDIRDWLADEAYFYPKILKTCFEMVQQIYVESFFVNTMAEGVSDPALVAKALDRDFRAFGLYYKSETFAGFMGHPGFYSESELQAHLGVLNSLSRAMNPHMEAMTLFYSVKTIVQAFGSSGAPAVLHLAGLRQQNCGHEDSAEWIQAVARATQTEVGAVVEEGDDDFDDEQSSCSSFAADNSSSTELSPSLPKPIDYRLPDLRNSRFLQNLKSFDRREMARGMSARNLHAARATTVLLDMPPTGRPVVAALRRYGYMK